MVNEERSEKHKKNIQVELCLEELETLLAPIGKIKQNQFNDPQHKTIFIVGCARSGTTLVNQILVKHLDCCYPSNFISRFYYAPYIGSLLQKLMYDFDFNGELLKTAGEISISSVLGKTKGPLSPNEFWYYWRKHFNFEKIQKLDESLINTAAASEFASGLYSIQNVFDKPLVLKGMIMNWNIPYLEKLIKNSFFVFVERDLEFNAQSLLLSRKEFFNDENKWYSFYPEEYFTIKDKQPEEQVVAQVYYTNRAIRNGLSLISQDKYMCIKYSDFCNNPQFFIDQLCEKLNVTKRNKDEVLKINDENKVKIESDCWDEIKAFSKIYELK
jgi:hypothetical protein